MQAEKQAKKEELLQLLVEQKGSFSTYAALELLEQAFGLPLEKIELSELELKGNPAISISSDDLHSVQRIGGRLILQLNNASLVGVQGPMPMRYAEELLRLTQAGDYVLQSFLDFFNHRIIQNLYRIRKSCYFHFYSPTLFQNLCSLFEEKKRFKSNKGCSILASRIPSAFVLREIIAQVVGPEVKITIQKGLGKLIKFEQNSFPNKLGKIILGKKIWVNEMLCINLNCSSREQYEKLVSNSIVQDVVAEYAKHYEVRIFLEKVKYRQIFLGGTRLLLGICL